MYIYILYVYIYMYNIYININIILYNSYVYIYIVCVYSAYKVYNGCRSNAVNFQQAQVAQAALDRR